jgi:hypothetical protein
MTDILYIGAVPRSGTTILERTLATGRKSFALGEVVHLGERGVKSDEPCGCGEKFSECRFWSAVGDRAFGGWDTDEFESFQRDRRTVDRHRYIPLMLMPQLAPRSFRDALRRYVEVLDRMYTAITDTAADHGQRVDVLIDSSKHPSYLFLLRALPSHRVHLLHVVRDPRGVANSFARLVYRPETGRPMAKLMATGTARVVGRWTAHNLLLQAAGWLGVPRRRLSYERFTDDPSLLARTVDELLGPDATGAFAIDGSQVTLGTDHTVSGNPVRFTAGTVTIRPDDSWRREMSPARLALIAVLTTPLRQVYAR